MIKTIDTILSKFADNYKEFAETDELKKKYDISAREFIKNISTNLTEATNYWTKYNQFKRYKK